LAERSVGIRVEGDIQASGAEETFAPWKFSNPWFGTLRGRVGYALGNVMFYGTGGLAFGELRATTFGVSESHTNAGWTAGVGAEMGFAPNWSAKVEYLYVDLPTAISSSPAHRTAIASG
jgi:Opacity protein and related surface antigens